MKRTVSLFEVTKAVTFLDKIEPTMDYRERVHVVLFEGELIGLIELDNMNSGTFIVVNGLSPDMIVNLDGEQMVNLKFTGGTVEVDVPKDL